eukprot:5085839-Pleurochrysis_carterae.AAC.1
MPSHGSYKSSALGHVSGIHVVLMRVGCEPYSYLNIAPSHPSRVAFVLRLLPMTTTATLTRTQSACSATTRIALRTSYTSRASSRRSSSSCPKSGSSLESMG